jgi:hypothetical protein
MREGFSNDVPCPCWAALLCAIVVDTSAVAGELQKAEKQINRITAMAADMTARRIVSRTVSDMLNVRRQQLQQERCAMALNYGSLFLAHELTANGASMSDIAAQLRAGKTMVQIASDRHADWKQIAADAKKLNSRIEDNLYKFFVNDAAQKQRDDADLYHRASDVVSADVRVSQKALEEAQQIYLFWREPVAQRKDSTLDPDSERNARRTYDPVGEGNQPGQVSRSGPSVAVGPPH